MIKTFIITVLGVFYFSGINAQQSIHAAGGEASGSGTVSYSIGQTFYTHSDPGHSITAGVQHAIEIYQVVGIAEQLTDQYSLYPNPTTNSFKLRTSNVNQKTLRYFLYDLTGKLIRKGIVAKEIEAFDVQDLKSSVYLMKLTENDVPVASWRIIKN